MIAFWAISALLAAAVLAVVLRPLLRKRGADAGVSRSALNLSVHRDQLRELEADRAAGTLAAEDYERSCRELERRLLEDVEEPAAQPKAAGNRRLVGIAGIALPIVAVAVYFAVGNPRALAPGADPHAGMNVTPQQVQAMVERLAAKLKDKPDDVEGWKLLGRSYTVMGRFAEAAGAYARAAACAPGDAQLLADFADALAMARGQSMQGEPEKLVLRALEIDPANLKALALAGTAAFDRKDYAAAAARWARMLPLVPPDSEDARTIQANVNEARSLSGSPKLSGSQKLSGSPKLNGVVKLAPHLAGKVAPDDTVFIFARAEKGPPMPLAVLRKQVRELPLSFALDDSMAMAPGMNLSGQPRVVVGARVSKSGSATPQPGDLQGVSPVVASNAQGVAILIDTLVR